MKKRGRIRHSGGIVGSLTLNQHSRKSVLEKSRRAVSIVLPNEMDFEDNYEVTCSNLRLLRDAVTKRIRIRRLDFSGLKAISTSAALALASEIDQWNQRCPRKLKAAVDTWHPDVKKLLMEMGFFELLEIKKPSGPPIETNTIFLRFRRGESGPGKDGGAIAVGLRSDIEEVVGRPIKKPLLFGGISEAITNVGHHAYDPDDAYIKKQWWVSASYNKTTRELNVTFYDHGRGIPVTLPTWKHFKLIRDLFPGMTHSEKIASAVVLGKSATGDEERGQGLQNLLEFSRAYENGMLTIYSLKGEYQSVHAFEQDVEGKFEDRQNSIGGTLIEWSVSIQQ